MARPEKTVFISYRRTNIPWALSVFLYLTQHGFDVFFDYEGVGAGDFESIILDNITSRAHFLVILTPSALERCSEPGDWLRREIETAIATKRNIVPLLMESFDFYHPKIAPQLTGSLAALKTFNGIGMPAEYLLSAMEKLRTKFLTVHVEPVQQPTPVAQQATTAQNAAAQNAPPVQPEQLTAQEYFERAVLLSDPDEEIRLNTEAIRLKPDFAEAYNNRGIARQEKGDLDGAISDYDAATRYKPDHAEARNNRGNARQAKGDLDGAILDYNEAIRINPVYAEAYNNRGVARYDKGDPDGAILDYNEAIRLKPDYAEAHNNRAIARRAKGDLDAAILDYNGAIRLKPDYADAYVNRAIARKAKGDLDGAILDYNEAIRLKPDYASAHYNRAIARKAQGDLDGAILDYNEAIRLKPGHASAHYNRAEVFEIRQDIGPAMADFQRYLDLGGGERDGDTEAVKQRITRLNALLPEK